MIKAKPRPATGADDVQRISDCMIGAGAPASLAQGAVFGMEFDLLRQGWPVGRSLGALPAVQKRLGLGRPASREAVTMLEARGMLDVRRGPGGGLFVAAPALEDVAGAVLMYLALGGQTHACVGEFRMLVWRMIVHAAIQRRIVPSCENPTGCGFAVDLAEQTGNTTMGLLARLAEMLVGVLEGAPAPARDAVLEAAVRDADQTRAFERLDALAMLVTQGSPVVALDVAERSFSLAGRKSAMALAARMAHELSGLAGAQEAEWETAERLGYTDSVVRQARRILQDFGIIRCRQGRKGAVLAPAATPTGAIRLLAPCLVASATVAVDLREAIANLVSAAPVLAAQRVQAGDRASVTPITPSSNPGPSEVLMVENLLLDLSGNPLLAIVVRSLGIANVFVAKEPLVPPHIGETIALNRAILKAIQAGDVALAGSLAHAKFDVMQRPMNSFCAVA